MRDQPLDDAVVALKESRFLNAENYVDLPKDSEFIAPRAIEMRARLMEAGLQQNALDLQTLGYTVIPPERVGGPGFADRLRETILDVTEKRRGRRPDLLRSENPGVAGFGHFETYLLFEDPIFQQAIMDPLLLTLVDHLLGVNACVSTVAASFKGKGEEELALHTDNTIMPEPFPNYTQVCNATILLTDYTKENGALCFVPGSHHYCRNPRKGEALEHRVAIEAPAGSMVFWGSNIWHGAFARSAPGLRMAFIMVFRRPHIRPQEPYREDVTAELLAKYPPRFATLMGQQLVQGYRAEGASGGDKSWRGGRHYYD